MSYSRWGSSTWYTFWSAIGDDSQFKWPTKRLMRAQCFQICDMPSYTFTYGELVDKGHNQILANIFAFYKTEHPGKILKELNLDKLEYEDTVYPAKNPSCNEILELFGYISNWEDDVVEHFKFWTFMRYEWWYPIRNQILWKIQSIRSKFSKKRT